MSTSYLTSSTKSLERLIALVRMYADEPTVDAKYADADLILMLEAAFQQVLFDINTCNDSPIVVRHNITLASGSELFVLPPNVEQVLQIAKIDTVTGLPEWWIRPGSKYGMCPIVQIEGRTLRLAPKWNGEDCTVQIKFVPTGEVRLHYGTAQTATSTTVRLAATPTLGSLDTRENAYVGSLLRIVSATTNGYVQERPISAYSRATLDATLESPLTGVPAGGDVVYEIVPTYGRLIESVVACYVARELLAIAGNAKKVQLLTQAYLEKRRVARQQLARTNNIMGDRFETETMNTRAS